MPEPTAATITTDDATVTVVPAADVAATAPLKPGQLPADACPEPTMTMEDFLAKAKSDGMPLNMPEATLQIYKDAQTRLPSQTRFFHVASDYYSWPYADRARVMGCPSTFHLCKTLTFENTKFKQDESKAIDEDRYWCVIVQYEGAVNITKLEKAVREVTGASRKATHMRIAPAEKSLELTGFKEGGVCPVGMRTDLPILVSKELADLSPKIFYLGAGHLDWKIAVPFDGFVENWNTRVVDFS
ncbi:MAG: YbaK/aminoacyl-tRNA synthetase-associated domain-containing protein [Linnemannia elongata]|nr:MAG: YbaK/aminoacyl-tRNA synthetase-associated domain-containing protein [Linnemannia elongata]